MPKPKLPPNPWESLNLDSEKGRFFAHAMKAMATGEATEHQQAEGIKILIEQVCRTYDLSYRPASTHDTAFAEGMRHVGTQLVRAINHRFANQEDTENG